MQIFIRISAIESLEVLCLAARITKTTHEASEKLTISNLAATRSSEEAAKAATAPMALRSGNSEQFDCILCGFAICLTAPKGHNSSAQGIALGARQKK